jgi:hypothetical protein
MPEQTAKDEAARARRFTSNAELRALKAEGQEAQRRKDEAASAMLAALKALHDYNALPEHNPQWPAFDALLECPADHEYECGGCRIRRAALAAIAQAEAAGIKEK